MLALYNEKVYDAEFLDDKSKVCLFTFKETESFKKNITMFGDTVYEKILNVKDIEELYGVDYQAEYSGTTLYVGCSPEDNKLYLNDGETTFAKAHGFSERERGVWFKEIDIDEASKFFISKYDYKEDKRITYEVTKDEFIKDYIKNKKSVE